MNAVVPSEWLVDGVDRMPTHQFLQCTKVRAAVLHNRLRSARRNPLANLWCRLWRCGVSGPHCSELPQNQWSSSRKTWRHSPNAGSQTEGKRLHDEIGTQNSNGIRNKNSRSLCMEQVRIHSLRCGGHKGRHGTEQNPWISTSPTFTDGWSRTTRLPMQEAERVDHSSHIELEEEISWQSWNF